MSLGIVTALPSRSQFLTFSAVVTSFIFISLEAKRRRKLEVENAQLSDLLKEERLGHARTEKKRKDELAGRKKAQEQLRKAALSSSGGAPASGDGASAPLPGQSVDEHYPIIPIAKTRSCFLECGGVPRQPGLADATRAILQFNTKISPASFDGLTEYSHVWVVFVFHCNTNAARIAEVHANPKLTFPATIHPPKLGGRAKVGVLACRTPHHPNPIGLSLAKLESVDALKRQVVLSGSDLVDGTPILDIKPYIHWSDTPNPSSGPVRVASFTEEGSWQPRRVTVSALAEEQLKSPEVAGALRVFQGDVTRMRRALVQVLSADIGRRPRKMPYILLFDGNAVQILVSEGEADTEVQSVRPHSEGEARPLAVAPELDISACLETH